MGRAAPWVLAYLAVGAWVAWRASLLSGPTDPGTGARDSTGVTAFAGHSPVSWWVGNVLAWPWSLTVLMVEKARVREQLQDSSY